MNTRIRELADHAGFIASAPTLSPTLEKFAELIVQECIDVVDCVKVGQAKEDWDLSLEFAKEHLKNHFGVEQ